MIELRELRIGNYVLLFGELECVKPSFFDQWEGDFEMDCQMIPISEEWMLKFGCKKGERRGWDVWELPVNKVSLAVSFLHDCVRLWAHGLYWDYDNMYVHSIQNICFSLTGQELTIKTPEHVQPH